MQRSGIRDNAASKSPDSASFIRATHSLPKNSKRIRKRWCRKSGISYNGIRR